MADLSAVIEAVQAITRAVFGVRVAPDYPPEALNVFPSIVAYDGGGVDEFGVAGERRALDSIVLEVHFQNRNLPIAVSAAMPYRDSVVNALMDDPTLDGTCDTFASIDRSAFQPMAWGDPVVKTLGWRFTITGIKRRVTL